ncbi:MAG TPA: hypothetical protein VLV48_09795, partial [Thermoanaerobaculia bacterium]|nr:hypothetical protein [Thermoanaerobaculia bacterium]
MPRRPLLVLSLLLVASSALADLRIGAPVRVSTPEFEPVPIFASIGLTESDGRFLATWSRAREAVRLDADGDPLDLPPLELLPEPLLSQRSERAVSDGSGWLIVTRSWQDPGASALVFDRVTSDGATSRAGEIRIPRSFGPLDVAGSDGRYAALFALEGGVTAGIITFDSALRASEPVIVDGLAVAIAEGGDGFGVLLRDRVILVGPSGSVTGSVPLPAGIDPRAIAAAGSSYVVASVEGSSIVLHRIDGGAALPIARFDAALVVELVMGASGDRVLLLWSESQPGSDNPPALLAARATLGGATEGPVFLGESANDVAIAEDGEGWLAGWIGAGPANASMFRTRRIGRGEPLSSIADDVDQVVWDTPAENARAIARSGERALALWSRAGDAGARAALFDPRGRKIADEIAMPVSDGVAGASNGFLVYGLVPPYAPLASGPSRLLAYRVSLDGVVDPAPIAIAEGGISEAVIECAGDLCLAAWRSSESLSTSAVRVARIRGSEVLDPGGVPVYFPTPPFSSLAIATDGAKFLIAANRTLDQNGSIVNAILVDPAGSLSSRVFDALAA